MTSLIARVLLFAVSFGTAATALQPLIPSRGNVKGQPQSQQQAEPPKQQPAPPSQTQTANDEADRRDQRMNRRYALGLSIITTIVLGFQVWLLFSQNRILKKQSDIMDGQKLAADQQATHMFDSLTLTREAVNVAKQSAAFSEKALVSVQRAFVLQKRIDVGVFADATGTNKWDGWALYHLFENSGNTPANNVEIFKWIQKLGPNEPHITFEDSSSLTTESGLTLGPHSQCQSRPFVISAEESMRLFENTLVIYVHAEARYIDSLTGSVDTLASVTRSSVETGLIPTRLRTRSVLWAGQQTTIKPPRTATAHQSGIG